MWGGGNSYARNVGQLFINEITGANGLPRKKVLVHCSTQIEIQTRLQPGMAVECEGPYNNAMYDTQTMFKLKS